MPFYDYRCAACGHLFEEWVASMAKADEPRSCPRCGKKKTERQISAPTISSGAKAPAPPRGGCQAGSGFS